MSPSLGKAVPLKLDFPIPVAESGCKIRIARKSSYVELVAPMDTDAWKSSPALLYPVLLNGHSPTAWNMPYLNLHNLPILDVSQHDKMQWLITHALILVSLTALACCALRWKPVFLSSYCFLIPS
ncbi:uncharacterized protein B0I36DRAFT_399226 [Microdochium trichocladiopsis]|uniref:Uncharacterized protein n=1 Tax=Microdochium trichocladiopsis TaxID=1682393 RepID=A0A9P9BI04_9PEZI|nr:uncharacterized protein B0I36DRAFT_399226 [Microdochium trichocladiopsis]KAH7012577.1 hypothetical protein B0I36DRAFT_399226 [Microdochium trichocladiopsis]